MRCEKRRQGSFIKLSPIDIKCWLQPDFLTVLCHLSTLSAGRQYKNGVMGKETPAGHRSGTGITAGQWAGLHVVPIDLK
jgi:hypothetical protein